MNSLSSFKQHQEQARAQKELVNQLYGSSRTAGRFLHLSDTDARYPVLVRKGTWVLRYFNIRAEDTSDYICYDEELLKTLTNSGRIPCIEFNAKNGSLTFVSFDYKTKIEKIPPIVHSMIKDFSKDYINSCTPAPSPVNYLKMYIAVLDTVPDYMVPTLVAHTVLGAHLHYTGVTPAIETSNIFEGLKEEDLILYDAWLTTSFRKCVVRVNQKEFDKISKLHPEVYLGHENSTLNGVKSCAIPLPVWHLDVPKVLKFSKLWKPSE